MESHSQEFINTLVHLLERAEKGLLERDELYRLWPGDESGSDPFIEQVWEDLEDATEHLPASLLTGKVNLTRWRQAHGCKCIIADRQLVTMLGASNSAVLLEKRRRLLSATS